MFPHSAHHQTTVISVYVHVYGNEKQIKIVDIFCIRASVRLAAAVETMRPRWKRCLKVLGLRPVLALGR